jgi:hypothetical protein
MSLKKDLTITLTNESEGTVLVLKTASALGNNVVSITGDHGVFDIKELQQALEEVQLFYLMNNKPILTPLSSEVYPEHLSGIHLP